jgi:hypothetical protein
MNSSAYTMLTWFILAQFSQEALDSRTFGPLPLSNIVGRAIYCSRSRSEHGFVQNSDEAMHDDSAVLAVELDVEEMTSQS